MKLFDKDWWSQQLYKEQILESDEINELEVNPGRRVWDFSKYIPNFDPSKIKEGDKLIDKHLNLIVNTIAHLRGDTIRFGNEAHTHYIDSDNLIKTNDRKKPINELGISNQNKLKVFSTYSSKDNWVPRGIFIYFKRNNSTNLIRIEGYWDADSEYIKFETLGNRVVGKFFKCLNIPFKEDNEIISVNYNRFLIKDLKNIPSNQDRNEWYNQIPENINELEVSPRYPQIGQQYDIKVWWGSDDWNYNKYLQKVMEPTDGTIGGKEGWYWSKYWTYGKKFSNGAIGFVEENGDVADYVPGETIFRKSRLNESQQSNKKQIFKEFIQFCLSKLNVKDNKPKITLTKDKSKTITFAHYNPNNKEVVVYIKDRNILDICRSLAHELKHWEQDINNQLKPNSGTDGSEHENEANSFAGVVLREFGRKHPELYTVLVENKQLNELNVSNTRLTPEMVHKYFLTNFNILDDNNLTKRYIDYMDLSRPYSEKYQILGEIGYLREFEELSYEDLIEIYKGMQQIVQKYQINELNINPGNRTWDLNKPGVKFENIKSGDIIAFNLFDTKPPTLVKQVVVRIVGVSQLITHDLGNEKAIDFWHRSDVENFWKKNQVNELEINPTRIKFPLKVNKEQFTKVALKINELGYTWFSGETLLEWNPWDNVNPNIRYITIVNNLGNLLQWSPPSENDDLNEGIYGDYLFGDKTSGAEFYGGHKEIDVNKESNLFKQLKKYVTGYKKEYSEIDLSNLVTLFNKLRKEYPEIVDPKLNKEAYIYRGTCITQEQLDNYSEYKTPTEYDQGYIINNITYNSRRKVQSWSTDYYNAATFAASKHKEGIPVIIRVKVKDADLFWNPHFINLINGFKEDEVLNTKLPLKADLMVVNLDKFEDEETFELSKYINIPK